MTRSRVLEAFTAALLDDDPQALYDKAPCGYLTLAPDGTVVKTNDTLRTMLRTHELTGTTWQELLSPAGRVLHETLLMPTLRLSGAVNEVAVDLECPDGTHVPVLLNATAERDPQGRVRLVRVAVFDATERRRYEQDLVHSAEEARAAQRAAEDAERRLSALVDTLQGSLVPRSLPAVPGLSVAGAYHRPGPQRCASTRHLPDGAGARAGADPAPPRRAGRAARDRALLHRVVAAVEAVGDRIVGSDDGFRWTPAAPAQDRARAGHGRPGAEPTGRHGSVLRARQRR